MTLVLSLQRKNQRAEQGKVIKNDMTTNDSKQHLQAEGKQQDTPSLQF